MIDPVSERARASGPASTCPWRWALAGAVGLHLAVVGGLAPAERRTASGRSRSPASRCACIAAPIPRPRRPRRGALRPRRPPGQAADPGAPAEDQAGQSRRSAPSGMPFRHSRPARHAAAPAPEAVAEPAGGTPAAAAPGAAPGGAGGVASASGGIVLGAGAPGEEPFPFSYYLNRVSALIESNWFRPPAAAGAACRVRCVIDRSGRLAEAGLEKRERFACVRPGRAAGGVCCGAVPAPARRGSAARTLTLHLEFGP